MATLPEKNSVPEDTEKGIMETCLRSQATQKKSFPTFPPLNIHTVFDFGQTMVTEQKMLSSESIILPKKAKERIKMSNSNNQINVPQAREAMDRFKMQAAQDEDVSATS